MAIKISAKPTIKAVVSKPSRAIKKPSGAAKPAAKASKATKAKQAEKYPGMLGMTQFTRDVPDAVSRASTDKCDILFSTNKSVPQIRLRPASLYEDEVDEIPAKNQIKISQLRKSSVTYRALVMIGEKFLVTSDSHKVIMDRHPDYPAKVVEEHMENYRRRAVSASQRMARKHAYRASKGTDKILDYLETISAEQEARDEKRARRDSEILVILREVSEKGILTAEQKASIDWAVRTRLETVRVENEKLPKRLLTEKDLDRYEVNN